MRPFINPTHPNPNHRGTPWSQIESNQIHPSPLPHDNTTQQIQQAGERAVAPGTPVHSLQKRLRLRSPLTGGGQQEQEVRERERRLKA